MEDGGGPCPCECEWDCEVEVIVEKLSLPFAWVGENCKPLRRGFEPPEEPELADDRESRSACFFRDERTAGEVTADTGEEVTTGDVTESKSSACVAMGGRRSGGGSTRLDARLAPGARTGLGLVGGGM